MLIEGLRELPARIELFRQRTLMSIEVFIYDLTNLRRVFAHRIREDWKLLNEDAKIYRETGLTPLQREQKKEENPPR